MTSEQASGPSSEAIAAAVRLLSRWACCVGEAARDIKDAINLLQPAEEEAACPFCKTGCLYCRDDDGTGFDHGDGVMEGGE